MLAALFLCTVALVSDGDTLRCRELDPTTGKQIRVRLSGIAAREMKHNRCAPNHPCPDASAQAARAALVRIVGGRRLRCEAVGRSFERTVAWCRTPAGDVSCLMVRGGWAAYWRKYDPQRRMCR